MKVTCRLCVAVFLATIGLNSYAAGCDQAQTQAEMNQCAAEALNQADSDLNATYLAYREKLNPSKKISCGTSSWPGSSTAIWLASSTASAAPAVHCMAWRCKVAWQKRPVHAHWNSTNWPIAPKATAAVRIKPGLDER